MFTIRSLTCCVLLAGAAMLAGCQGTDAVSGIASQPATPSSGGFSMLTGSHIYHYYPEQQVYYCPDRELYFFQGAGFWTVSRAIPSTYELDNSQRLLIGLETAKPYQQHTTVVAQLSDRAYPGANPFDRSGSAIVSVPTD